MRHRTIKRMRRLTLIILLALYGFSIRAQEFVIVAHGPSKADSLYYLGKEAFEARNYKKAIHDLELSTALDSSNVYGHYYLGYAYSRMNSTGGNSLVNYSKDLCIKASREMEYVIRLDSAFGAELILSPYSKITSEWGSLALSYLIRGKTDSAHWAFAEGKRRGGFSPYFLASRKLMLEACDTNAILFTAGDDNYWNLLYLQFHENIRKDIALVELNLLKTPDYQGYLIDYKILDFQLPRLENERLDYQIVRWSDTLIEIPVKNSNQTFHWHYQSAGSNPYMLNRGDLAMQSIMISNHFMRDVYFTPGVANADTYFLFHNLEDRFFVLYLNPLGKGRPDNETYNKAVNAVLDIIPLVNTNSEDERREITSIRIMILQRVYEDWSSEDNQENARYLMKLLETRLPTSKYPAYSKEVDNYYRTYKRIILEGY